MKRIIGKSGGFTLMDTLIGSVILAVSLMIAVNAYFSMEKVQLDNSDRTYALTLAQSQIEKIKARIIADPNFFDRHPLLRDTEDNVAAYFDGFIIPCMADDPLRQDYDGRDFEWDRNLVNGDIFNPNFRFIRQIIVEDEPNVSEAGGTTRLLGSCKRITIRIYYANPNIVTTFIPSNPPIDTHRHKPIAGTFPREYTGVLATVQYITAPGLQ